ncbi:MAG TPA: tetratricopeptide repeat protein [Kofleriaceae bacterium]|nr:tetratricopeptide repeat protein [Kofleriaceae bacterium]
MTELYSIKDVSRIFALQESRLRYWMQTGFVGPTVRKGGRFYYTFTDLVGVKVAKDLLAAGLPLQTVRKNLVSLRSALPHDATPAARLRICSDGETIVAVKDEVAFEPATGQVVMAFNLPALAGHVYDAMQRRGGSVEQDAVPAAIAPDITEQNDGSIAYRRFIDGCSAEDADDAATAEHRYLEALELQPSLAAARTNLGNLLYRKGDLAGARAAYEVALEHEPGQPEARYNLANVLEDQGETELAIAELRRVCATAPDFADAHYNLGLLLAKVGGAAQAKQHLERYLELDAESEWSARAREFLAA